MKVLKNHFEKLLLVLTISVLMVLSLYFIFGTTESSNTRNFVSQPAFTVDKLFDDKVLKIPKDSSLLPSQVLHFISSDNEVKSFIIQKIIFKRKCKVSIHLKNNTILRGGLLNSNPTIF